MGDRRRLRTTLLLAPPALITLGAVGLLVFGFVAGRIADRTAEDKAREVEAHIERSGLTYERVDRAVQVGEGPDRVGRLLPIDGTELHGFGVEFDQAIIILRTETLIERCIRVSVPRRGQAGATVRDC